MESKSKIQDKKEEKKKQRELHLQKTAGKDPVPQAPQPEEPESEGEDGVDLVKQDQEVSELDPVDFLLVEPSEGHYHSLKNILIHYRGATANKVPNLADYISKHKQFGVAIIQDVEDNDSDAGFQTIFSILTLIPTTAEESFVKDMKKHFVANCEKHSNEKQKILKIINQKNCSFLINDRYINLIPKLVPLQHETLAKDFEELRKSDSKNKIASTEYLLGMTKVATESKKSKDKSPLTLESLLMYHFQNSELLKSAEAYWLFPDESKLFGKQNSFNLHYVLSMQKYLQGVPNLKSLVQQ